TGGQRGVRPMRWVLPGGAVLGRSSRGAGGRPVACRPLDAGLERRSRRRAMVPEPPGVSPAPAVVPVPDAPVMRKLAVGAVSPAAAVEPVPDPPRPKLTERLATVKLLLEVLAVLVGLVGAVLA